MVGTIIIHGSDGKVMAPIGDGSFIPGQRQDILITSVIQDEDVPIRVRQSLVGMVISTIFSSEQLKGAAPPGSRTAYGSEVVEALQKARKKAEANLLEEALKAADPESEYSFLVFEDGTYEYVKKKRA
jgi:hypothetical protein